MVDKTEGIRCQDCGLGTVTQTPAHGKNAWRCDHCGWVCFENEIQEVVWAMRRLRASYRRVLVGRLAGGTVAACGLDGEDAETAVLIIAQADALLCALCGPEPTIPGETVNEH